MASITITVPDAVVPRIRAAFGAPGPAATVAQVEVRIKDFVKNIVKQYEAQQEADSVKVTVDAEVW